MRVLARVAVAGIISCTAAFGVAASAQATAKPAPALNGNAYLLHVGANPPCGVTVPGKKSGEVNVHLNAANTSYQVNISVRGALPKTTYAADIRCVALIGTLTTNASGHGTAHLTISSPLSVAGTPFFVDVSVPPASGSGTYGDTFIAGPFKLGDKGKPGTKK
jgi:hypothetical protein